MVLIYYDIETTGLENESRIIEIAAYREDTNTYFHELINPGCPIPPESTKIHKITDKDVKNALNISQVLQEFNEFCKHKDMILVAHNNDKFDKIILQHEYNRSNIEMPMFQYMDTLKIARTLEPNLPSHTLTSLASHYKIDSGEAHQAMTDISNMYKVYQQLKQDRTDDDMLKISQEYKMDRLPFGKHKGVLIRDIPESYIRWMMTTNILDDPDIREAVSTYFNIIPST